MRGFEQAISKPRYHLTQFHRPAMLKLVTVQNGAHWRTLRHAAGYYLLRIILSEGREQA